MATSQAFSVEYRLMGVLYTDGCGGTRTGGEEGEEEAEEEDGYETGGGGGGRGLV